MYMYIFKTQGEIKADKESKFLPQNLVSWTQCKNSKIRNIDIQLYIN